MIRLRTWPGRILLVLLPLPALILVGWTLRLNQLESPRWVVGPGGDTALVLPMGGPEPGRGARNPVLLADGSAGWIETWESAASAPDSWLLWSDDRPPAMGRLLGVVVESGDTLRGSRARDALRGMPQPLARDEHALLERLRRAADGREKEAAWAAIHRFQLHQNQVVALLSAPGFPVRGIPLVRIRHAETFGGGSVDALVRTAERLWFRIRATPDSGSGGGLWGAVVATCLVVLLAGILGGVPSLLMAVHLADQIDPGAGVRWLRWASEGLSGVPGVVWGCVCAALLAYLGPPMEGIEALPFPVAKGIFWAGLTLGVLSAPITFSRAMEAIDRVPRSSREIARSCGATRHQVLFWVVLPACKRGLLGAWLSGMARAAGETAPLLLVGAAGVLGPSWHFSGSVPPLGGEFLHLGAMALVLPWPDVQTHQGHPLAFLALTLLASGCLALEWAAIRSGEAKT